MHDHQSPLRQRGFFSGVFMNTTTKTLAAARGPSFLADQNPCGSAGFSYRFLDRANGACTTSLVSLCRHGVPSTYAFLYLAPSRTHVAPIGVVLAPETFAPGAARQGLCGIGTDARNNNQTHVGRRVGPLQHRRNPRCDRQGRVQRAGVRAEVAQPHEVHGEGTQPL